MQGNAITHLHFMGHSVPSPRIVTMLGKLRHTTTDGAQTWTYTVPFPHLKFCTLTTGHLFFLNYRLVISICIILSLETTSCCILASLLRFSLVRFHQHVPQILWTYTMLNNHLLLFGFFVIAVFFQILALFVY